MIKFAVYLLTFLCIIAPANAQQTLGFSDSTSGTNQRVLFYLKAANFNVTTDQALLPYLSVPAKYKITEILVTNCSVSMTTAQGGFYTAISKGGTVIGATTTPYTACISATTLQDLKAVTNMDTSTFTASNLYLSLTAAQGAAATADVYVLGIPLN